MSEPNKKALNYALNLLSKRSYSKAILEEKLLLKDFDPSEIVRAISRLEDLGFVDDKKYCENLVREYSNYKKYGRARVKLKLREKKIDDDLIAEALEQIDIDIDSENLSELTQKYLKKVEGLPRDKQYSRTISFLIRRGYSYDAAKNVFNKYSTKPR